MTDLATRIQTLVHELRFHQECIEMFVQAAVRNKDLDFYRFKILENIDQAVAVGHEIDVLTPGKDMSRFFDMMAAARHLALHAKHAEQLL